MKSLFDLPAHILLVHYTVVMIPLACVAAVLLALRPRWRRRYGWALLALMATVVVSTMLSVSSGEEFEDVLELRETIEKHESLGQTTRWLVIGLFFSVAGLVGFGRWSDRARGTAASEGAGTGDGRIEAADATDVSAPATGGGGSAKAITGAFVAATLVLSVLSTVWVIRTGHEGARVTWSTVDLDD